jgi:ectoine hydroxylase-related dioxygenase (phytanoyl-CoA dioxygenase family)
MRLMPAHIDPQPSLHQDGRLQGNTAFVTVWLALTTCGTDSHALSFLPRRVFDIVETDLKSGLIHRSRFSEEELLTPEYQPGDIVIHTPYNIHGSFSPLPPARERISADIRFR